jgi:acetylornithine deacetylase/succinyl-diaminopimelate desuccinylase-like protein
MTRRFGDGDYRYDGYVKFSARDLGKPPGSAESIVLIRETRSSIYWEAPGRYQETIVARRLNPASAGVVTVGSIHAGSAPNVIPDRAVLTGTVRAVDPLVRRMLHDEVRRISEGVAATHRLESDFAKALPYGRRPNTRQQAR